MRILVLLAAAVFIFSRPGEAPAVDPHTALSAPYMHQIEVTTLDG